MCSSGARGLWMDMLCLMHEGTPYGHLTNNGKDILPGTLARLTGNTIAEVEGWIAELVEHGVAKLAASGTLFSSRMVRDEEVRQVRAAGGVKSLEHPKVPQRKGGSEGYPSGGSFGGSPSSSSSSSSSSSNKHSPGSDEPERERSKKSSKSTKHEYSPEFETAWDHYPHPPGDSKVDGWKAWSARIREGHLLEPMTDGIGRYATYCIARDTKPQYRKQFATFFGPGLHFQSDWTPPANAAPEPRTTAEKTRVAGEEAARQLAARYAAREQHA